jgi:hypothetical protein
VGDRDRETLSFPQLSGGVAQLAPEGRLAFSPWNACHAKDLGAAEGIETVHEGFTDLDFAALIVEVACGDAVPEVLAFGSDTATACR